MLCYAVQYGWGAWDRVHEALLRTPRVRYDYYLHSLPDWAIGRRCEHLIRVAEKDLLVSHLYTSMFCSIYFHLNSIITVTAVSSECNASM
jgi:SLIDE